MKKILIADVIKAVKEEIPVPGDLEDAGIESDMSEFNPDMGEAGTIDLGSLGEASFYYDYTNGNYVVDISFESTGDTVEYILEPLAIWISRSSTLAKSSRLTPISPSHFPSLI